MTLTSTRWPSYELDPYSLRYTGCANINFPRVGFRKLSYYNYTKRQIWPKLYSTPLRGWSANLGVFTLLRCNDVQTTCTHQHTLGAVRDDTGPSAVMTTQLPRLSWRVTTDDDLVIFSFDPRIIRWNQVRTANRWNNTNSSKLLQRLSLIQLLPSMLLTRFVCLLIVVITA